jgi:hypothetical protein
MAKTKKRGRKNKVLLAIVVLLVAGFIYWVAAIRPSKHASTPVGGVNYNPPSQQDKQAGEDAKKTVEDRSTGASQNSGLVNANVIITSLTTSGVRGYVSNVFEDGGTCTLTLTKGTDKITATSTGVADVNKTTCAPISIDQSQLKSGDWTAVLSYTSAKASGSSAPQKLTVP